MQKNRISEELSRLEQELKDTEFPLDNLYIAIEDLANGDFECLFYAVRCAENNLEQIESIATINKVTSTGFKVWREKYGGWDEDGGLDLIHLNIGDYIGYDVWKENGRWDKDPDRIWDWSKMAPLEAYVNLADLIRAYKAIDSIAELPDNWNGYGAPAIPADVVKRAYNIVTNLSRTPGVTPTALQGIQLDYEDDEAGYIAFELLKNGTVEMYFEDTLQTEYFKTIIADKEVPDMARKFYRGLLSTENQPMEGDAAKIMETYWRHEHGEPLPKYPIPIHPFPFESNSLYAFGWLHDNWYLKGGMPKRGARDNGIDFSSACLTEKGRRFMQNRERQ